MSLRALQDPGTGKDNLLASAIPNVQTLSLSPRLEADAGSSSLNGAPDSLLRHSPTACIDCVEVQLEIVWQSNSHRVRIEFCSKLLLA